MSYHQLMSGNSIVVRLYIYNETNRKVSRPRETHTKKNIIMGKEDTNFLKTTSAFKDGELR